MRTLKTLLPLEGLLWIAGEVFHRGQVHVDLDERKLFIKHRQFGELVIDDTTNIFIQFLDLNVPTFIRNKDLHHGWETVTPKQLIDIISVLHPE